MKTREQWLEEATVEMTQWFVEKGYELPSTQVSVGFPKGSAKAIGQCFDAKVAEGGETFAIFISPTESDVIVVLATLLHELIHSAVGIEAGHKGPFRKLAKEFGLAGKMTATYAEAGSELFQRLEQLGRKLGEFNHKKLTPSKKASKKTNSWERYMSTEEPTYRVLVSPKMVNEMGAPFDPWGNEMVPVQ